ncbi:GP4 protein [DeBrazza's monkey arterivirus]|uniref:GP4 protein n=1 Tax=DeBrazza's monkey arterivirus TaxID=1965063 RepID=A0A0B6C107_9NIDO|nr:GP4 protein [DeBrazza's monkey arterivirus]AJI43732.1 GP4 protein [DeBrazza's monkey arterivirus]
MLGHQLHTAHINTVIAAGILGVLGVPTTATTTPHPSSSASDASATTVRPANAHTCLPCFITKVTHSSIYPIDSASGNVRVWSGGCATNFLGGTYNLSESVSVTDHAEQLLVASHCLATAVRLAANNHSAYLANYSGSIFLCHLNAPAFNPVVAIHPGAIRWASIITLLIVVARLRSLSR